MTYFALIGFMQTKSTIKSFPWPNCFNQIKYKFYFKLNPEIFDEPNTEFGWKSIRKSSN